MKFKIAETIDTVPWSDGVQNAPPDLITKAKAMTEQGQPATFGKVAGKENAWVIVSVGETDNLMYIAHRS